MDKILRKKIKELGESDDQEMKNLGTRLFVDSSPTYKDFKIIDPDQAKEVSEEQFNLIMAGHAVKLVRGVFKVTTHLHDYLDKCIDQNCKICQAGQVKEKSQEEGT